MHQEGLPTTHYSLGKSFTVMPLPQTHGIGTHYVPQRKRYLCRSRLGTGTIICAMFTATANIGHQESAQLMKAQYPFPTTVNDRYIAQKHLPSIRAELKRHLPKLTAIENRKQLVELA